MQLLLVYSLVFRLQCSDTAEHVSQRCDGGNVTTWQIKTAGEDDKEGDWLCKAWMRNGTVVIRQMVTPADCTDKKLQAHKELLVSTNRIKQMLAALRPNS